MNAAFHEAIHTILDQVDAYRTAVEARDYSPTVSEMMACQYHALLLEQMNRSLAQASQ